MTIVSRRKINARTKPDIQAFMNYIQIQKIHSVHCIGHTLGGVQLPRCVPTGLQNRITNLIYIPLAVLGWGWLVLLINVLNVWEANVYIAPIIELILCPMCQYGRLSTHLTVVRTIFYRHLAVFRGKRITAWISIFSQFKIVHGSHSVHKHPFIAKLGLSTG